MHVRVSVHCQSHGRQADNTKFINMKSAAQACMLLVSLFVLVLGASASSRFDPQGRHEVEEQCPQWRGV